MKVYNKSCENMSELLDCSVDLVITSPPYKDEDGYSDDMIRLLTSELNRVMKNDSLAFINFGHLSGLKDRPFNMVKLLQQQTPYGQLLFVDTIIWVKSSIYTGGHYTPINSPYMLNNMFEYIFQFSKGNAKIDKLSIGVPYKDKSNIARYGKQDIRCAGNVWYVTYPTVQSKKQKPHKDMFPEEIPKKCIKLSGIKEGSLVLDPFMGSGTTGRVAEKMGMESVGYELNQKYFEKYIF